MAIGFTCGANAVLNQYDCVAALTDHQLLELIAIVLYRMSGETDASTGGADEIMQLGVCYKNFTKHEKLVAFANILLGYAVTNNLLTDYDSGITAGACLNSVSDQELEGLIVAIVCAMFSNYTLTS